MSNAAIFNFPTDYEQGFQALSQESQSTLIENSPFFPAISLVNFRNQMRLDGTITDDRLRECVIEAMIAVNEELQEWQSNYAEYHQLEDLPAMEINGESVLIYRYKRAVYCLALANLYERYIAYDSSKEGEKKADLLKASVDELRRDARFAISDILKRHRVDAELI
ncbi:phage head protein [Haemophilus sputorum]|uniref:Phage head protein n=1 Tax=Haemophilus sputorum TaxID=1078480 RepID=A0A369YIY7_9PAST|nr:head completion/stabilization protein [Haemophilus sputorum]RDE73084.1 phage head protein [Haemophilus sputorum]